MKFIAAVAAFAGVAYAQDACLTAAAAIPPCALGYLVQGASSVAQCGLVDFQCQCSNSADIQNAIVQTVLSACGANSAGDVINSVSALCACATSNAGQQVSLNAVQSACSPSAFAIPPCALGYLASAGNAVGQCAVDDFACQCQNSAAIQATIANDVNSQCSNGGGLEAVLSGANALCACVSSNGGGGSGGAETTPAGTSPTGGSGGDTTAAPTGTGTGGGAGTSPSSSFTRFTGAAASAIPAVGGIFGAVIGLLAYL